MPDRHGQAFYPGVGQVQTAQYVQGHGISPGIAILTMLPQVGLPLSEGDLVITDNFGTITIPDCKVDVLAAIKDSGGLRWQLTLKDRRWRWRDCGLIAGRFNVVDDSGQYSKQIPNAFNQYKTTLAQPTKYIPWTTLTPLALATLCLDAMNETGYSIDLPNDVFSLPKIDWDYVNPAQALQRLCDQFNRLIVYDWYNDVVNIVQKGFGLPLPEAPYYKDAPSYSNLQRPDEIILVGAPLRYQVLLQLQAVGEDWDGSIRPIQFLSYAPVPPAVIQSQITQIAINQPAAGSAYTVTITPGQAPGDVLPPGPNVINYTGTDNSMTTVYNALAAKIAAIPALVNFGISTSIVAVGFTGGEVLQITGPASGITFGVAVACVPSGFSGTTIAAAVIQISFQGNPWSFSGPPDFSNVKATDQLTYSQAKALAQKSVFKWYQVVAVDPANNANPLIIPDYGPIVRREQLVLQDNKVIPILPMLGDDKILTAMGEPYMESIYDSTYKTQPAACYGQYATAALTSQGLTITNPTANFNTQLGTKVAVPFTIMKEAQVVQFANAVWYLNVTGGVTPISTFEPANLFLETAVQILDPDSNQVVRYLNSFFFPDPQGNPPQFIRREDVQANVVVSYDYATGVVLAIDEDTDYAEQQSQYYLTTLAAAYEIVEGRTREYPGIVPIILDGAISQFTWEIGPGGAKTHASRNSEHEIYYPRYPERKRLEYLAPPEREVQQGAFGLRAAITDPRKS